MNNETDRIEQPGWSPRRRLIQAMNNEARTDLIEQLKRAMDAMEFAKSSNEIVALGMMCLQSRSAAPATVAPATVAPADMVLVLVPKEPTEAHLEAIAMLMDHGYGLMPVEQQENMRRFARQVYQEVTGQGIYKIYAAGGQAENERV